MGTDAAEDADISDDELTALALAADIDEPIDPDAVPFGVERAAPQLLPAWYMPAPMATSRGRTRRVVVAAIIGSLVIVNGAGLCVTYGFPEIAW